MLICLLIYLLISNAVTLRRDKSIPFYIIVIMSLLFTSFTYINNLPVQIISQIEGDFYLNPYIAISLTITLFSFAGIPSFIGFFAKLMDLSAALDNCCVFIVLVAILTTVISATYYLNLTKQMFFYKHNCEKNPFPLNLVAYITFTLAKFSKKDKTIRFSSENIKMSSPPTDHISVTTLVLLLFIYVAQEWFNIVSILSVIQFKS